MRLSDGSSIDDWTRPLVPVTVEYEPEPDPSLVVLAKVLDALEGLREALGGLPAPTVHVAPPNMDALLAALANGTPPPSADEIAEAMAARIHQPVDNGPALAETVREAVEKLGKQLQFPVSRPAAGGGSVSLASDPNRQVGIVSWASPTQSGDGEAISSSGSNTLHTPATGKKVRLRWIYLQATGGAVTATVKLGSSTLYVVDLSRTGVPVFSHSTSRLGDTDAALTVTLSAAETVLTNFDVTEET